MPLLLADFILPEPANYFAHYSWHYLFLTLPWTNRQKNNEAATDRVPLLVATFYSKKKRVEFKEFHSNYW